MAGAEERTNFAIALLLIALAGWIDAVGFLAIRGIFPSFMSGNSTTLAVDVVQANWSGAARIAVLLVLFVAGAMLGELITMLSARRGQALVVVAVAVLLWLAVVADALGIRDVVMLLCLSLAMGVQNAAVHRAQGIQVTLTYVTGTLVHLGQACARLLLGREAAGAPLPWAGLWAGLMLGSLVGGTVAVTTGRLLALAVPAVVTTALAGWRLAHPTVD